MKTKFTNFLDDYAAYHKNPKNKLTHYFGIPLIVFAIVALLRLVGLGVVGGFALDLAAVVIVLTTLYYLTLNAYFGLVMLAFFALCYFLAPFVPNAWVSVGIFVFGWILQFWGHKFEGKSPAFLKNAVHLLIGPVWILNDALLKLGLPGYKGQPA